jgi:hypothetical protein
MTTTVRKSLLGFVVTGVVVLSRLGPSLQAEELADAQQLVRQALHADLHGLSSERRELLAAAAQNEGSPLSQAYQGKIRQNGQWVTLEESAQQRTEEEPLKTYEQRRAVMTDQFRGHVALAQWCESQQLTVQAQAHLLRALDFEPENAAIRQQLGHLRQGQRWLTPQEAAQQRQEIARQIEANEKWGPIVARLKEDLSATSATVKNRASHDLLEIDDPQAIPALEAAFASAGDKATLLLLETLADMTDPRASLAIARLAVLSNSPVVREEGAKLLSKRDPQSFMPALLAEMHGPLQSRANVTLEPDGRLLYRHEFSREGQDKQHVVVLDTHYSRIALQGGNRQLTFREAMGRAREQAQQREQQARLQELGTQRLNDRIAAVLRIATGEKQVGSTPDEWWQWWEQANEAFTEGSKPQAVYYASQQTQIPDQIPLSRDPSQRCECFVAGTPVWTLRGNQAIEQLHVGDLVLSQNVATGELEYKPVIRTTQRTPTRLVRLTLGNEVLDCTGGHLFWVIEQGWVKARDLKPGTVVHGVRGTLAVTANEPGEEFPTFNLVVADHHNYFVGESRCLTHDNTPQRATTMMAPGVARADD